MTEYAAYTLVSEASLPLWCYNCGSLGIYKDEPTHHQVETIRKVCTACGAHYVVRQTKGRGGAGWASTT